MIKRLLFFLCFFVLFYVEPLRVGEVSIAVIWKAGLVLSLLFLLLHSTIKAQRMPKITFWGLIFAVQSAFNASFFVGLVENVSEAMKNTFVPMIYGVGVSIGNSTQTSEAIYRFVVLLSYSIVFSTVPFLVGLISPISAGYDLSIFGFDTHGFVGVYQTAHGASITIGTALVVLFFHLVHSMSFQSRIIAIVAISIGLYSVYLTYARTGYFILVVGFLVLLYNSKSNMRYIWLPFSVLSVLLIGFALYEYSSLFRMRLVGLNIYTQNTMTVSEALGSGRERFWVAVFDYFLAQDLPAKFWGLGSTVAKEMMLDAVGMRIYAHNGFIDILQFNGFLGAILYLIFLTKIWGEIRRFRFSKYFPLVSALFVTFLAQMIVQGERIFLADMLFALSIVAARVRFQHQK